MPISKLAQGPTTPTPPKRQLLIGLVARIAGLPIVAVATGIIPAESTGLRPAYLQKN
jgi:hypothetical protein